MHQPSVHTVDLSRQAPYPWAGRFRILAVATLLTIGFSAAAISTSGEAKHALEGFDQWVESVMKEWKVPGLGVAIIYDNQIFRAQGYGYRDLENRLPANGDTLFAIGSNTKSFTATILAMLEDDGKLDWEEPVQETLTDFRLYDPVATSEMNAVDLLTHRSGLPRHDLVWYGSSSSRRELYARLRYLEPTEPFRARFQYQNLMFMTAGILAEEITGKDWEELVKARLFAPLGMGRSNLSIAAMQRDDNFSYPYFHTLDGEVERIPFRNIDAVGPAGSINSSAREMAKYVLFHLNRGKVGAEEDAPRLLSEANASRMQSPQMVIQGPIATRFSGDQEIGDLSYGLGLMVSSYRGHRHVFHGGGIDGFISAMEWLPNDGIGVVVLSNTSGSARVPTLVARNVLDRLLGLDIVDWAGRARKQDEEAVAAAKASKEEPQQGRHQGTTPSHALADFAGTYQHPAYGKASVTFDGKALTMTVSAFQVPLEHYHYDVFAVPADLSGPSAAFAGSRVQFLYAKDGRIDRVAVPLEPSLKDIVFQRVAGEQLSDPNFLARLTGTYKGAMTATVALSGTSLTLTVPGQPTYDLIPASGMTFEIKGLQGFHIEFDIDEDSNSAKATALIAHQPNGTFRAPRSQEQHR